MLDPIVLSETFEVEFTPAATGEDAADGEKGCKRVGEAVDLMDGADELEDREVSP